jgi:hypothetical protein
MSFRNEDYYPYQTNRQQHQDLDSSDSAELDFSEETPIEDLGKLWRETLKKGMHGICFSMYEDGQEPGNHITMEQVERRIEILKPYSKAIVRAHSLNKKHWQPFSGRPINCYCC